MINDDNCDKTKRKSVPFTNPACEPILIVKASHRTEFRLVCATNKNLEQARASGEFRTDLYYRIASWVFRVPSLAERREDILPLTEHFLRLFRPDNPCLELDRPVREYLLSRHIRGTFVICDS